MEDFVTVQNLVPVLSATLAPPVLNPLPVPCLVTTVVFAYQKQTPVTANPDTLALIAIKLLVFLTQR